ncbi:hypothetical protein Psyc_1021 [Psychrobacter arcticus 273-4]|uniref:Uncharacterized protein n=1 Tax=Psychrobacter arcticus (strain DSM 17307 / VKM B-2377 / 273-4) TaxID=259536 RepID=Q4FSY4_PSYA2|nr:hypothetical protein [Psychrobacter arcticus]AAZ18874.1 hypothetical protein Psyc_1021 [Psychrobacter arcticus 273-4]
MILASNAKNAMLQGLVDTLNVGTNAKLSIYIGTEAAAVFDMPNPIEQSIVNGVLTFNLPTKVLATISGQPTNAKLVDSAGVEVAEFNVSTEIVLDKASIYSGGYVSLIALSITI